MNYVPVIKEHVSKVSDDKKSMQQALDVCHLIDRWVQSAGSHPVFDECISIGWRTLQKMQVPVIETPSDGFKPDLYLSGENCLFWEVFETNGIHSDEEKFTRGYRVKSSIRKLMFQYHSHYKKLMAKDPLDRLTGRRGSFKVQKSPNNYWYKGSFYSSKKAIYDSLGIKQKTKASAKIQDEIIHLPKYVFSLHTKQDGVCIGYIAVVQNEIKVLTLTSGDLAHLVHDAFVPENEYSDKFTDEMLSTSYNIPEQDLNQLFDTLVKDARFGTDAQSSQAQRVMNIVLLQFRGVQNNTIELNYRRSVYGRFFVKEQDNSHALNPQSLNKKYRDVLMQSCYEYDMEAAHPRFITQIANTYDIKLQAVEHYVQNKNSIRAELSQKYNMEQNLVKDCFNAMSYGSKLLGYGWLNIPKEFRNDPFIQMYQQEQKISSDLCVRFYTESFGNSGVKIPEQVLKDSPAKKLAFVMQMLESEVVKIMIQVLGIQNFALLLHDGVYLKQPATESELSQILKAVKDKLLLDVVLMH